VYHDSVAPPDSAVHQVVARVALRSKLLDLALNVPAAANLAVNKTQERIQSRCGRSGITGDCKTADSTVDVCPKSVNGGTPAVAPLQSAPVVSGSSCRVTKSKNIVSLLFVILFVCLSVGLLFCHQVRCDDESIPMTGFVTSFGFFRWKYMPFGLRNAPATFSRLVCKLVVLCESFCVVYLDDVLIFSETWSDHVRHLSIVFGACAKCWFNAETQ